MKRLTRTRIGIAAGGLTLTALAVLAFASSSRLGAQEVSDEALAALDLFIATDSEVGEEQGNSLRAVLPFLDELEEILMTIAVEGPPEDAVEEYQQDIDELWERRAAYTDGRDAEDLRAEGLDPESAEIALATTEDEYRSRLQTTFDLKYREKAVILLAFLEEAGSVRAGDVLNDLQADADLAEIVDLARERAVQG